MDFTLKCITALCNYSFKHNTNKTLEDNIIVRTATADDAHYADTITTEMAESAKARGTGIAKRSPDYVKMKMEFGWVNEISFWE